MTLVWGAGHWLAFAGAVVALTLALLAWGYRRTGANLRPGLLALTAGLKALGIIVLALCLLEPMFSGTRARPGANLFVVLADNSRSMSLKDRGAADSRGDEVKSLGSKSARWPARLGQDFDVRQHSFDAQLRALPEFEKLSFDGPASGLGDALWRVARRYQGRPLAGVLLFTDGSATDAAEVERLAARAAAASATAGDKSATMPASGGAARLPPVYPVLLRGDAPADDLSVGNVTVTQTSFEDAPVTIAAEVSGSGYGGRNVLVTLADESGRELQRQTTRLDAGAAGGKPSTIRFSVKPEKSGVSFYRVAVSAEGEPAPAQVSLAAAAPGQAAPPARPPAKSPEATLENNTRLAAVDRGGGPYRVLYVSGRPNWEYKFLQRAVAEDDQVRMIGLLRIAKREPKFNFMAKGSTFNPLYQGFDPKDKDKEEQREQYDQPVLVRLFPGDEEDAETKLRGGFPKTPEELYAYHAVILADVEAEFFTQDQMQLLKEFVRKRGGGLLMLGGLEAFHNGKYDRTPIGDLLPVYSDEDAPLPPDARFRLALTREGWLEPWVRLRPEEDAERERLAEMPSFDTLSTIRGIKPGATVLARVEVENVPNPLPALVEQRFGQGRVGAMLVGDLWRWGLRRPENSPEDLSKAWRQTVRWLVADVPRRVDLDVRPAREAGAADASAGDGGASDVDAAAGAVTIAAQVRDPTYSALDNATVVVQVTPPDGKPVQLTAAPSSRKSGVYEAIYVPREPGPYRAKVTATAPDGSDLGSAETGWASDPAADEFRDLRPNRPLLERLARATGGQVVPASDLEEFVKTLPTRHADVTEPYVSPVWHQPWVFLLAILCLTAEWGLRRWKGLP